MEISGGPQARSGEAASPTQYSETGGGLKCGEEDDVTVTYHTQRHDEDPRMFGDAKYRPCTAPRQPAKAVQIKLSPEVLQQLLNSGGKDIAVDFDDNGLRIGKTVHKFSCVPEGSALDICRFDERKAASLRVIGKVGHRLTVQRQLGGSATDLLRSRQAEERAAKENRAVQEITVSASARGRTLQKVTPISRSATPDKGLLPAAVSKIKQATSIRRSPLLVASSPKLVVPLKTRVLQLLAVSAQTADDLRTKLRTSEPFDSILQEHAIRHGDDLSLKDEAYALVKVWDWKSYTTAERSAVISRATEAFDRMKLPMADLRRQKLIHPEKRLQAGTASEISDTSPLELGPSPIGSTVSQRSDDSQISRSVPAAHSAESAPRQANGLMSLGKKAAAAKRKAPPRALVEEKPAKQIKLERQSTPADIKADVKSERTPVIVSGSTSKPDGSMSVRSSSSEASTVPTTRIVKLKVAKSVPADIQVAKAWLASPPKVKTTESAISLRTPSPRSLDEAQMLQQVPNSHDRTSSMASTASVRSTTSTSTTATSMSIHQAPRVAEQPQQSKFLQSSRGPPMPAVHKKTPSTSLSPKKSDTLKASPQKNLKEQSPIQERVSPTKRSAESRRPEAETEGARTSRVVPQGASSEATKAERSNILDSVTKRDDDLNELAGRFRRQYPEYKRLHEHLQAVAARGPSAELDAELAKFQRMHDEMQDWKKTLYAAAAGDEAKASVKQTVAPA